jgi:hypothetical protein
MYIYINQPAPALGWVRGQSHVHRGLGGGASYVNVHGVPGVTERVRGREGHEDNRPCREESKNPANRKLEGTPTHRTCARRPSRTLTATRTHNQVCTQARMHKATRTPPRNAAHATPPCTEPPEASVSFPQPARTVGWWGCRCTAHPCRPRAPLVRAALCSAGTTHPRCRRFHSPGNGRQGGVKRGSRRASRGRDPRTHSSSQRRAVNHGSTHTQPTPRPDHSHCHKQAPKHSMQAHFRGWQSQQTRPPPHMP